MIQAIIFDGEGVVIDTEELWDRAQVELLGRRGLAYDRPRIKPLLTGRSSLEGAEVLVRELGLAEDPTDLARERLELVRAIVEEEVRFIPGFLEFFRLVQGRYRTCMATAMDGDLLAIAHRKLRLGELFGDRIVTLRDVGNRSKPEPDLFLEAARRVASRPEHCLVIEDAPHGIEAARRAGMVSVGLATTYPPEQLSAADLVATCYPEISEERLERLGRGAPSPSSALSTAVFP